VQRHRLPRGRRRRRRRRRCRRLTAASFRTLLREAKVTKVDTADGAPPRYEVTLIEEGLGNPEDSNVYTAAALREAADAGIFEGLQAYADHPTRSEERDQPERSIRKLVGHYENVRFVEGDGGAELRGEFVPIEGEDYEWVPDLIESSLKAAENTGRPLIGISIDGGGAPPRASSTAAPSTTSAASRRSSPPTWSPGPGRAAPSTAGSWRACVAWTRRGRAPTTTRRTRSP
jgi:hypothetical protein